jgi:hypothetical protein
MFFCRLMQVLRGITSIHRHPTALFDYGPLFDNIAAARRDGLPIVRDMRAIYLDFFPIGSSRKAGSSCGVYWSSGVISFDELQHLGAYSCLTQFPKGVAPMAVLNVFKPAFQRMQTGFRVRAGPLGAEREVFHHAAIGIVKRGFPSTGRFHG